MNPKVLPVRLLSKYTLLMVLVVVLGLSPHTVGVCMPTVKPVHLIRR
jgi:hypothetical protein